MFAMILFEYYNKNFIITKRSFIIITINNINEKIIDLQIWQFGNKYWHFRSISQLTNRTMNFYKQSRFIQPKQPEKH